MSNVESCERAPPQQKDKTMIGTHKYAVITYREPENIYDSGHWTGHDTERAARVTAKAFKGSAYEIKHYDDGRHHIVLLPEVDDNSVPVVTDSDRNAALTKVMDEVERVAEAMYYHQTDNHPTMHCNRFPLWSEISDEKQQNIRDMAQAAISALIPEGSVVVPREATPEVLTSIRAAIFREMSEPTPHPISIKSIYTAMVKATASSLRT
jgi:hypothetical protein